MNAALTRWPEAAKTVVSVTIHIDGPSVDAGKGLLPLGVNSRGRYSIQRGVHRYLDMLARYDIKGTFFASGYDVEHWPALFRLIADQGHELAAHGYQHEGFDLGEREPALLEKTHMLIANAVGKAPVGWCSPSGRKTALTIPTLRRLGYVYDASEKDLNEPYLLETEEGTHDDFIVLPNNTVSLDDSPVYNLGMALASEIYADWEGEFDALHASTGYLHLTVHPKAGASGTPGRAAIVARFLEYARGHDGVRFETLESIAAHCLKTPDRWRQPDVLKLEKTS